MPIFVFFFFFFKTSVQAKKNKNVYTKFIKNQMHIKITGTMTNAGAVS